MKIIIDGTVKGIANFAANIQNRQVEKETIKFSPDFSLSLATIDDTFAKELKKYLDSHLQ